MGLACADGEIPTQMRDALRQTAQPEMSRLRALRRHTYAVVGNLHEVIPALVEALRARSG